MPTPTPTLKLPGLGLPLDTYDAEHGHFPTLRTDPTQRWCQKCKDVTDGYAAHDATSVCRAGQGWAANTLTVRERGMLAFMNDITDKAGWEDKVFDETIVAKWNEEALALGEGLFEMFAYGAGQDDEEGDAEDGANNDENEDENQDEEDEEDHEDEDGNNEDGDNEGDTNNGNGLEVTEDSTKNGPDDDNTKDEVPEDKAPKFDEQGFSQSLFDWCIQELRAKAKLQKETGMVAVLDGAAAVFKSDVAVDEALCADLCTAASPLEDGFQDWHPGSDGKVLDLVHPSLWPLVYGRTRAVSEPITLDTALQSIGGGTVIPTPDAPKVNTDPTRYSTKFQWLPAEVEITPDGPKFRSYINNLHPVEHKALYPVLERLLERALPLLAATYGRVMDWQKVDTLPVPGRYIVIEGPPTRTQPWNRIIALQDNRECLVPDVCKSNECSPDNAYDELDYDDDNDEENEDWWDRTHPPRPFLPRAPYVDVGVTSVPPVEWKNIQVIVKLANIHLTPDKPTYEGGTWHVEGLWNEHIAATALYYYDSDNVTDSHLAFQTDVDAELMQQMVYEYPQNEHGGFRHHYGVDPALGGPDDGLTDQFLGSVRTNQGRLLTFPNVLQHRVGPFELADKTKPGHRKIVAFFLVDPTTPVVSTAHVPPQQRHWAPVTEVNRRLPTELADIVADHVDCPFKFETAVQLRDELMAERRAPSGQSAAIPKPGYYSFCEH